MTTLQDWLVSAIDPGFVPTDEQVGVAISAIRDLGAVAVVGSSAVSIGRLRRYAAATAGTGAAVAFGTGEHLDPVSGALVNGSAAQAFDFDDIAPSCVSHVSALMVPAIAAIIDRVDPVRALHGYVRGLMVIDRLAESFTHEVYDRGIQPTHTMGSIGAVTALLWAVEADEATARGAYGLLATQMIGLRSHTGTRYKPVQAGSVASAAVRSVLMAQEGLFGGTDAIDVVVRLMGISDDELASLTRPGVLQPVALAPKCYPTCGAAHTAIEATVALRGLVGERVLDPDLRLRVSSPPRVMNALAFARPQTPDEARFSMQYCVATAWLTGGVGPEDFTLEAVLRPHIAAFADRIDITLDDALTPPPTWSGFPAIVHAVDGSTGTTIATTTADKPLGYPERPLSVEQMRSKFVTCVTPVLGSMVADQAYAALGGTDVLARLGEVLVPQS